MQLPSTHVNELKKLAGVAVFAPDNEDGTQQAGIPMSPSAELTYSMSAETSQYVSRESGSGEILDRSVDQVNRNMKLSCNQLTEAIQALFVVADLTQVSQASGTVTGEITPYVVPGRQIQLGGATNNSTGVFSISALTVEAYEGANAPTWTATTAKAIGDAVVPTVSNNHWYLVVAKTTGSTGATEPTFPTTGGTVVDGGVTLQDMGLIAYTSGTDFEVDTVFGLINLRSIGAIATAYDRVPAELRQAGKAFRLEVGYTRGAATFNQIASNSKATVTGRFWFYEDNAKGDNGVWYGPRVTLSPEGDLSLKTGGDYAVVGFDLAFLKPPVGSAVYRNGMPR